MSVTIHASNAYIWNSIFLKKKSVSSNLMADEQGESRQEIRCAPATYQSHTVKESLRSEPGHA